MAFCSQGCEAGGPPRRNFLPYDVPDFTGRATDLDRVVAVVRTGAPVVIDGMAGIGKSCLAIRVAHTLAPSFSDGQLICEQEVAGGRDVYVVPAPAVVTVKEGLNLPRYPSVPGRLRAKRKPLDASTPERRATKLEMVRLVLPPGSGKQVEVLGDDVATVLARTDYHRVAEGYGGRGILVSRPEEVRPALEQALALSRAGHPVLVNVFLGKSDFRKGSISM